MLPRSYSTQHVHTMRIYGTLGHREGLRRAHHSTVPPHPILQPPRAPGRRPAMSDDALRAARRPHPDRAPLAPGQESVWNYPRPPRLEPTPRRIRVVLGGVTIADSQHACCACSKPATRRPITCRPSDVRWDCLDAQPGIGSVCEWKGGSALLQRQRWRTSRRSGRLVLSRPDACLHCTQRPCGLLRAV